MSVLNPISKKSFTPYWRGIALVLFLQCTTFSSVWARPEFQEINWETLDLTTQQRTSLNSLDSQWKTSVSELAPRIQANQKRLHQLMCSSHPNEGEIHTVQEQLLQDKSNLKMQATKIFLEKRKTLTDEQQTKLNQMMNSH